MGKAENEISFFEGWYFKHQGEDGSVCLIPGINIGKNNKRYAFIQVITENASYMVNYLFEDFSKNDTGIRIKNSLFGNEGVKLDIKSVKLNLCGELEYGPLTPVGSDIMGPFRFFKMQCSHGVISMDHRVTGRLVLNDKEFRFTDGRGYIETDKGICFPERYFWIQCNDFGNKKLSIMAASAKIPILFGSFLGCICVVMFDGKEYRLASYKGARVQKCSENALEIKQGRYLFAAEVYEKNPQKLMAPEMGDMCRTIYESSANARFRFYDNKQLLFDAQSLRASFEYADESAYARNSVQID
ncbi:MAG: hypothetical protein BWY11_00989 [Firmicutes bacterium ADurb.Bin182]|nr:MAG: hypothetical protein BWY11_00989 [Firmicutes bacterium ADurb.Bin182]